MKKTLLLSALVASVLYANDYQQWVDNLQSEYGDYKEQMDKEFTQMLEKEWEEFKGMYSPSSYEEPKPDVIPTAPPTKPTPIKDEKPIERPKLKVEYKPLPKDTAATVRPQKAQVENFKEKVATIDYFDNKVEIPYEPDLLVKIAQIDQKSIAAYWKEVSSTNSKNTVKNIEQIITKYKLNDWGVYQLTYQFANKLYSDKNSANLLTWYLLTRLGYDTRVAFNDNNVYLLGQIEHMVYQVTYFTLDSKKYYVLSPGGRVSNIGNIYTYRGDYPDSMELMSFNLQEPILLPDYGLQEKTLDFEYKGKSYSVKASISSALVKFYKTLPQSDYSIYLQSQEQNYLKSSLLNELSPLIEGMDELEAVNFLLRFTQTAFAYATDDEQFGYEKVQLPQETLFYPYSDCEDRSIFFNFLVKNLTDLDTVGVKFDGHFAMAVAFESEVKGDGFEHEGQRYVMADPTYTNADVGVTMPQYKGKKFTIYR